MLLIVTRTLSVNPINLDLLLIIVRKPIPKLYVTRISNLLTVSSVITLTSAPILSVALVSTSLALPRSVIITLRVGE